MSGLQGVVDTFCGPGLEFSHRQELGVPDRGKKMATTTKITNVLKIAEFEDFAQALMTSERFSNDYNNLIDFLQTQTEAKQKKFWAFYDAKVGA